MEIQWKHVFILCAVIYLLVHLVPILNTIAGIFTDVLGAINIALEPLRGHQYRGDSSTYALARLCVFLIFIVGVLKVLKRWNRK